MPRYLSRSRSLDRSLSLRSSLLACLSSLPFCCNERLCRGLTDRSRLESLAYERRRFSSLGDLSRSSGDLERLGGRLPRSCSRLFMSGCRCCGCEFGLNFDCRSTVISPATLNRSYLATIRHK